MKIDFDMLEKIEAAGASARVVITMLRAQFDAEEVKLAAKRPKEAARKQRTRVGHKRTSADNSVTSADIDRQEATLSDTPRARLFREGKPALLTLKVADSRAGALIVGWLKMTHDDDQLVLATILRAQSLAVADAPGWILATLKGKTNVNGTGSNRADQQSGSAAILAGVAAASDRRARSRSISGHAGADFAGSAGESDPELFGARDD